MNFIFESPWLVVERIDASAVRVHFQNAWNTTHCKDLPASDAVIAAIVSAGKENKIVLEGDAITEWDSELPAFVLRLADWAQGASTDIDLSAMPEGVRKIVGLARSAQVKNDARRQNPTRSLLYRMGTQTLQVWDSCLVVFDFTGELLFSLRRWMRLQAKFRWKDVWLIIQKTGAQALPIVTLISFLVGMILAYVGVVQLKQFGATIYVANLVAIAMVREMGAIMTGVIMSGRTGAAFAAELGSMKVSEEVSALKTFGISPFDFLIVPRILAVVLMMPLLVLYANVVGILGGGLVAVGMELTPLQYMTQAIQSLSMGAFSAGMIKSVIFGAIVGFTGCLRGMQCSGSSESVGRFTTSAVVTSITWIIVADAIFAVLFNIFGI